MKRLGLPFIVMLIFIFWGSGAWSAPMIGFELSQEVIAPGDIFTVDISLKADPTSAAESYTSFGAFYDYDDSQMRLLSMTPSAAWEDNAVLQQEPTPEWYTAAGWAGRGHSAPPGFEEGEDLLVTSLVSLSSPQTAIPSIDVSIPLGTLEFECLDYGSSLISALNRPDSDYISGAFTDLDFDWESSLVEVNQVPLPGAVWILASGLLGLIGLRARKR